MGVGRRRTRQLRAHGGQHQAIAGYRAALRAGNFLHGVDQHRQPRILAVCRSPWLQLLAHCLSLAQLEELQLGSFDSRAATSGFHQSIASVYTDYGLGIACGGVLHRGQLGVAHKTAPCGTLITFRYAGRVITVPVIDRGPYIAGREWDLTGATAEALGFPGLGQIEWSVGPLRGHHLQAG